MPPDRSRSPDLPSVPYSAIPPQWRGTARPDDIINPRRRVLILISLDPIRELATEGEHDVMDITTRAFEPNILPSEELALFTYARVLTRSNIRQITIETLLYAIVDCIFTTWGAMIAPHDMDLRWTDGDGESFILRNHQTIGSILAQYRPFWVLGQGGGPQPVVPFQRYNSPYILRLTCHKALPRA